MSHGTATLRPRGTPLGALAALELRPAAAWSSGRRRVAFAPAAGNVGRRHGRGAGGRRSLRVVADETSSCSTTSSDVQQSSSAVALLLALATSAGSKLFGQGGALGPGTQKRRRARRLQGVTSLAAASPTSTATRRREPTVQLPELTASERERLQLGLYVQKQVRTGSVGWGHVVVDVQAPAWVVLDCLAAFERYAAMVPVVREARVLSRSEGWENGAHTALCTYKVSRFGLKIHAAHSVDLEARVISFGLDESQPSFVLRQASGFWYVEPHDENRDGSCRVWFRVGLRASSFLPPCLVDLAAQCALGKATSWLKPHMEELWCRMQSVPYVRSGVWNAALE
mmetsp:Transcript_45337/g.82006  ORF Transcript_45337/g.82006 Transcript_45337/m.82006 type:complete len:341 (+) Transcript_45337:81-1103(+)